MVERKSNLPAQTTNGLLTSLHNSLAPTMFRCSFAEHFRTRAVAPTAGIIPYLDTRVSNLTFEYSLIISYIYYYIVALATEVSATAKFSYHIRWT
jgi:hypothetical protein